MIVELQSNQIVPCRSARYGDINTQYPTNQIVPRGATNKGFSCAHHFTICVVQGKQLNIDNVLQQNGITYVLIGGLEVNTNDKLHVHIALIFTKPTSKYAVQQLFHRESIQGDYYCPRNQSYSYIGWKLHHIKPDTKYTSDYQLYEHGTLPSETLSIQQWKIASRFGDAGPKPIQQTTIKYKPTKSSTEKKASKRTDTRSKCNGGQGRFELDARSITNGGSGRPERTVNRTPERVEKAKQRLETYSLLLESCEDPVEQTRLENICYKIRKDYLE